MKVIFLDVDGVLNGEQFYNQCWDKYGYKDAVMQMVLDQQCLLRLFYIVNKTGAEVVLSSSWRVNHRSFAMVRDQLNFYKISVYGCTPNNHKSRGEQVTEWLRANPGVEEYVVLDDDDGDFSIRQLHDAHYIQTDFTLGLSDATMNAAIRVLLRDEGK